MANVATATTLGKFRSISKDAWHTLTSLSFNGPASFRVRALGQRFELDTATFANRSTYFAKTLSAFTITHPPHEPMEAIEPPDTDLATFRDYLHCLSENDAQVCLDNIAKIPARRRN